MNGGGVCKSVFKDNAQISSQSEIAYIYSAEYVQNCYMPRIKDRAFLTHQLIAACDLLKNMKIINPRKATLNNIKAFHSSDFVDFLKTLQSKSSTDNENNDPSESFGEKALEYGLQYDCELFDEVYDYILTVLGGSLTGVSVLLAEFSRIVINWNGGWHHAHRDRASGYCYVNDVVISMLQLRKKFKKILYVDLDAHHGDGVQEAFEHSKNFMTVSFHKFCPGFYPGTGSVDDIGTNSAKGYTVNVPFKSGIDDQGFCQVFNNVINKISQVFPSDCIVVQCGVDGLSQDDINAFNLTEKTYVHCIKRLIDFKLPILILGGGGYNFPNAAKCWTAITAAICNVELPEDIPDHDSFIRYGPGYEMSVDKGFLKNSNDNLYLKNLTMNIIQNLDNLQ